MNSNWRSMILPAGTGGMGASPAGKPDCLARLRDGEQAGAAGMVT